MGKRTRFSIVTCSLATALLSASLSGADVGKPAVRKANLGMYLDMVNVSDPEISPDGRQIIFTRRWVDKMNDKFESALYIMNADGSDVERITPNDANYTSPAWSP